jgi:4-aminobutyrate aminotransferase-like enzyme/Ser/Thr protein kinase RdoA (MazF antagonist)
VPALDSGAAARLASQLFGADVSVELLVGERDANFRIQTGAGGRFVLKLMNGAEGDSAADMQQCVLQHLAGRLAFVPQIIALADGSLRTSTIGGGGTSGYVAWAMTWLEGAPLAQFRLPAEGLLEELGTRIAELGMALQDFDHPAIHRAFHWDLMRAYDVIDLHRARVADDEVGRAIDALATAAEPVLREVGRSLPLRAVHNDLNDHNVLVRAGVKDGALSLRISGFIDFGDLVHSWAVAEPAVALAYVMPRADDPLRSAAALMRGYVSVAALTDAEIAAIFPLACLRMCMSLCIGAYQRGKNPGNSYLDASTASMGAAVRRMLAIPFPLAEAALRAACGLSPSPRGGRVTRWLRSRQGGFAPLFAAGLIEGGCSRVDLGVASALVHGDPAQNAEPHLTARIAAELQGRGALVGVGRNLEPRLLHDLVSQARGNARLGDDRTVHMGLDLFVSPGTAVQAPLAGTVHAVTDASAAPGCGCAVILRHMTDGDDEFFTRYAHVSRDSLARLSIGRSIAAGEQFCETGTARENGGSTPHLHFQVLADVVALPEELSRVVPYWMRDVWASLCPDPNLIASLPIALMRTDVETDALLQLRRKRSGPNLGLLYIQPLRTERGWMQFLFDEGGRRYLDAFNNVPHVGHAHPWVQRAVAGQLAVLNTNTRYLNTMVARYSERLCALFPQPLSVCFLVNSGSEATELAMRLARAHTGALHTIVLSNAYHGNSSLAIDLSPYKHNGPGGQGAPAWVSAVPQPDVYRGVGNGARAGAATTGDFIAPIVAAINALSLSGKRLCAFIAETCPSVGGQIIPPDDYFSGAYDVVRKAGGICIADEVQTGFGRMGDRTWAFERYGVVPEIVILGKPIGNGFPLAAVVTTAPIAQSFANGMEYFSTFGGSTASCAAGLAVLDVLEAEGLQVHASDVGSHLGPLLRELGDRHSLVGDVRGAGLFWGVELVQDRATLQAATMEAAWVCNRMREHGMLIGTDGPFHNVLKIRPPMPFNSSDAELLVQTLDEVLAELVDRETS